MEAVNLICVASNSKALIKMSLWNVHFEQQVSIGKIFPFLNWVVAGLRGRLSGKNLKICKYLPRLFSTREQSYLACT